MFVPNPLSTQPHTITMTQQFPDPSKIPANLPDNFPKSELDLSSVPVLRNYIDGAFEDPVQDENISNFIRNKNPATNKVLCYIPASGDEQVNRAAEAASRAHKKGEWRRMTPHERSQKLLAIAAIVPAT